MEDITAAELKTLWLGLVMAKLEMSPWPSGRYRDNSIEVSLTWPHHGRIGEVVVAELEALRLGLIMAESDRSP